MQQPGCRDVIPAVGLSNNLIRAVQLFYTFILNPEAAMLLTFVYLNFETTSHQNS